jgi:hypothetical protein
MADIRTQEVLDTMATAAKLISEHGLPGTHLDFACGSSTAHRWNPETRDFTLPVLPEVTVILSSTPHGFVRWCEALGAGQVAVERRELDVCLHATIDRDGITWNLAGSVSRRGGRGLPGITVDWKRTRSGRRGNHAVITIDDLRATIAAPTPNGNPGEDHR